MEKKTTHSQWTTTRLRKHLNLIQKELSNRDFFEGGQAPFDFLDLHSQPECQISSIFLKNVASGFFNLDIHESPAHIYQHFCQTHDSSSREFGSMTAIDEKQYAIENEYPKVKMEFCEMRKDKLFEEDYVWDYFIQVEKRAIRAGLISPEESICHKPKEK